MVETNNKTLEHVAKANDTTSDTKMINAPVTGARAEEPYVSIPLEVTLKEWGGTSVLVEEILAWLEEKGVQPSGAPFFRYFVIGDTDKNFKLEVGVPITSPMFGDDRVITGTIPSGKYATLVHYGHPDHISSSFTVLEEWAREHEVEWDNQMGDGEEVWGGRFEYYLTDPAVEPDFEKWSTEIAYKIKE